MILFPKQFIIQAIHSLLATTCMHPNLMCVFLNTFDTYCTDVAMVPEVRNTNFLSLIRPSYLPLPLKLGRGRRGLKLPCHHPLFPPVIPKLSL